MQREHDGGIIISCDFCGTDWDPYDEANALPMVEGHRGSTVCLPCVQAALLEAAAGSGEFECTMCLKPFGDDVKRWRAAGRDDPSQPRPPGLNPRAVICADCIRLAAKTFTSDEDVDWKWDGKLGSPTTHE